MKKIVLSVAVAISLIVAAMAVGRLIVNRQSRTSSVQDIRSEQVSSNSVSSDFSESSPQTKIYRSDDGSFQFLVPFDVVVTSSRVFETSLSTGRVSVNLPDGSVEISNVLAFSKIPFSAISKNQPFLSYRSCCSGTRSWYVPETNRWESELFESGGYDSNNQSLSEKKEKFPLLDRGICLIERKIGKNTYYRLEASDENSPSLYYYFLLTDQNYAFQILTPFDLDAIDSASSEKNQPNSVATQTIKGVLSSLELSGASQKRAECQ